MSGNHVDEADVRELEVELGARPSTRKTEREMWLLAEQTMTDDQYLAFWLRHHEDFTVTQIARMLGVSRQAVDARLEGGRRRLLKAMKEAA